MHLAKLLDFFGTSSPAIGLLRSPNAPYVIDFLDREFKRAGRIGIPHSELQQALIAYQEELQESHPEKLSARADSYLTDWCSPDKLWLKRLVEAGRDEAVYQLTPATQDIFVFLDRVLEKDLGFVGTESRLKLVIDTLADLVVGSSDEPQARLEHLRSEERQLQQEIQQIETEGCVSKYRPSQIRERFATAASLLRQFRLANARASCAIPTCLRRCVGPKRDIGLSNERRHGRWRSPIRCDSVTPTANGQWLVQCESRIMVRRTIQAVA